MNDAPDKPYRVVTELKPQTVEYTKLLQKIREKVVNQMHLFDPGPSSIRILPEHVSLGSDYVCPSGYFHIFIADMLAMRIDYEEVFGPEGSENEHRVVDINVDVLVTGHFQPRKVEVAKMAIEIIERIENRQKKLNACELEKLPLAMHVIDEFIQDLEGAKC